MVYDLADGRLRELAVDMDGYVQRYSNIYRCVRQA